MTIFLGATTINPTVESFVIWGRTEGSTTREFRSPGARSAPGARPCHRGDSKRRIQEAASRVVCKRCLQEVAPSGGSKRLPATSRRRLQAPRGSAKRWFQETAPRGCSKRPKANSNKLTEKKLFKKKKKKKKKKSTSSRLPEALTPRLPATVDLHSIFTFF